MKTMKLDELNISPEDRAELERLDAYLKKFLEDIKRDPDLATQFLKDIGLLDAEGNRVVLPGEEHLHPNGNGATHPENRDEFELMAQSKQRILKEMKRDPAVATRFLQDIGLLDAKGERVVLPGEESCPANAPNGRGGRQ